MKVLIGCEESGIVREAFRSLGHDAISNDLEDTRLAGPHLKSDVFDAISSSRWDLIILHPPCTALAVSGNSTYGFGKDKHPLRLQAKEWTKQLLSHALQHCSRVALENPVGVLFSHLGLKPQYIHPWQFGHPEQKRTGLGLCNLPPLVETQNVYQEMMLLPKNQRERLHYLPPSPFRARLRSETYLGIANAMATQWGHL